MCKDEILHEFPTENGSYTWRGQTLTGSGRPRSYLPRWPFTPSKSSERERPTTPGVSNRATGFSFRSGDSLRTGPAGGRAGNPGRRRPSHTVERIPSADTRVQAQQAHLGRGPAVGAPARSTVPTRLEEVPPAARHPTHTASCGHPHFYWGSTRASGLGEDRTSAHPGIFLDIRHSSF